MDIARPRSSSAPPTTTSTSRPTGSMTDLDLMVEARFSVIRVGESVWSTWEPEDGRFDLDWLQPVLDGAHERGISVILGTPTYAVPPWLARRYPEIAGETAHGQRIAVGRPAGDRLHPPGVPVPRRAGHPRDRRPVRRPPCGHRLPGRQRARAACCSTTTASSSASSTSCATATATSRPSTRRGASSTGRTGSATWADLWTPDGNAQPQYDLAWRRVPGRADHRVHRLAGRHRPRVRPRRPVRHHLHRLRAAGRRRRRPDPGASTSPPATRTTSCRTRSRCPTARHARRRAGRPRAPGPVPDRGPDVRLQAGAVPGHRDQRGAIGGPCGQLPRVRRSVAPGRLGVRRPRRAR